MLWFPLGFLACASASEPSGGPTAPVTAPEAAARSPEAGAASSEAGAPSAGEGGPIAASDPWTLRDAAAERGLAWPPPIELHVDKSARALQVRSGDALLKTYRVGLGGAPVGDKVRQGDQRTPIGRFTIVTRNDRSNFHLFLGLSYPMARDAERGLADGLISEAQARAVREAEAAGRRPPWDTALGGMIGIHGNGGGADWTLGCVAVEDAEIEELWEVARLGTVVVIEE